MLFTLINVFYRAFHYYGSTFDIQTVCSEHKSVQAARSKIMKFTVDPVQFLFLFLFLLYFKIFCFFPSNLHFLSDNSGYYIWRMNWTYTLMLSPPLPPTHTQKSFFVFIREFLVRAGIINFNNVKHTFDLCGAYAFSTKGNRRHSEKNNNNNDFIKCEFRWKEHIKA